MNRKAFTLVELLLVITMISVLMGIVLIAINPNRQLSQARNAQRRADVFSLYNAINQYRTDNSGSIPPGITNTPVPPVYICQKGCSESIEQIDITTEISPYMSKGVLPIDPNETNIERTGYTVYVDAQGKIVVSSPLAENSVTINTIE